MGFAGCHPGISFLYFVCVMALTAAALHPAFLMLSLLCAFACTWKWNGRKGVLFSLALIPCALLFSLWYASYHHFGITVLRQNMIANNITWEALFRGLVLGCMTAGILIWFSCVHRIVTTDKVVCLFGSISPGLSLFLAIVLRMVPRIKQQAKKLNTAQRGIGMAADQGNLWMRLKNTVRIFSMMITWSIDLLTNASDSMRSRGSTLRGRTAFSIYRFDNRDRSFVIALFAAVTVVLVGLALGQGYVRFDPEVVIHPAKPESFLFYFAYGFLCLMPLGLDLWTEYRFRKARENR